MAKPLIIKNHIIDAPIESILKELQSELTNGKIRSFQRRGDHVMTQCPEHSQGREVHPSFGIYDGNDPTKEYGLCNCFACGFSGNLQTFIASCFDTTIDKGEDWLIRHFGNTLAYEGYNLPTIELKSQKTPLNVLNEDDLEKLQSYHPYMTQRHLTQEVCNKFKIKYDPQTKSLIFPVWDEKGNYIFNTRRSVEFKYFNIPPKVEKPVYLLNYILKENIREVVVCESQINALTLWGYGIPAIALFGTGTQYQYGILNRTNIIRYILALDGDNAGAKGVQRFKNNIKKSVFVDVIQIPSGEDVNSLPKEKFLELYNAVK
jgi:DNA primase